MRIPLADDHPMLRHGLRAVLERAGVGSDGKSSKDIGAHLQIAGTTVETHRRQIMDKLNLRAIAELTKYAVGEGVTSIE